MTDRPLTHAERRQLIEAPISITRSGGRGWAGASFAHIDLFLHRGYAQGDSDVFDSVATFIEGDTDVPNSKS